MTLPALIGKLTAAKAGSTDLDNKIDKWRWGSDQLTVTPYTSSIDAALTLLPEDLQFGFNMDIEETAEGWCGYVWLDHPTNKDGYCRTRPRPTKRECNEEIPLAICIAALKGRR